MKRSPFRGSAALDGHFYLIVLGMAMTLSSCSKPTSSSPPAESKPAQTVNAEPWFEETAARSGLDFHHVSGHMGPFYMPEINVGGAGLLDFDRDGYLDVYCVQGGYLNPVVTTNHPVSKLYRNLGGLQFADVTETAGVGNAGYGNGCACADFDGDGYPDIYVTNTGTNALYRNNGNGTFADVTAKAGVGHVGWGTSAVFCDYDGDGHLDLYVANYLNWTTNSEVLCYSRGGIPDYCSPLNYKAPAMDALYHNRGDGTFEDVSISAGLDKAYGHGMGVVAGDFNRDGKPDFFVANDAMPNQLWINQGNGKFVDEAMIRGCAVNSMGMSEAGMGIQAVDIYQRGWLDLFVTHLVGEGNRLFVNSNGYFVDHITSDGPGAHSEPYTGFGVGFYDFDNDGILDLYIANGRVKLGRNDLDPNDPFAEPNILYHGLGEGRFKEVPLGGTARQLLATSRGVAFGDLDNDGGVDMVIINRDGPLHFLHNIVSSKGHWIQLNVLNHQGNLAVGAMIRLVSGGKTQWRQVQPNSGYCSSNDPRVHFGLGASARVEAITVEWPSGAVESFGPLEGNRLAEIRQGQGH
jgi:enediyne biosynthesis protein E4